MESIPDHARHGPADPEFPPPGGPWEAVSLNGRLVGWAEHAGLAQARRCAELGQSLDITRLVVQPVMPHLRVHAVVCLFPVDLGGEPGELRVVRGLQLLESTCIGFLVEVMTGNRLLPVE